jgi:2'-5' RNA ligase
VIPPLSLQLGEAAIPPRPALPPVQPQTPALPDRVPFFRRSTSQSIRDTKSSYGVPDGTVVLYLAEVEDLLVYQQVLMRSLPADAPVRWTPVEQLHVTLVHAPLIDEPEFRGIFQETVPFPGFTLRVTQVTTFESDGPIPIIALVEPTEELKAFQSGLYDSFALRGVAVSEHSLPANWTPHITLGYADGEWAKEQSFDLPGDVTCYAGTLALSRGDYETIEARGAEPLSDIPPAWGLTSEGPERELRAWRRVTLRKGAAKGLAFECTVLPASVRDAIRLHLALLPDDRDTQAEVFRAAERWLACEQGDPDVYSDPASWKAIQATRLEFENAFEDVLREARAGSLDRRRWATLVRSLLRRSGIQAFRDGLVDGGVDPGDEPLDPEDQAELNRLLAEQSQYVTAFGEALFERGVSDPQAEHKPTMWFHKSILPLYQAGRLSADRNGLYEWLLGRTEEHCRSCLAAVGQRHRLKDWYRAGVITQADLLECRGFNCDCKLQKTSGRARGRLDRIPLGEAAKHVHLDSVLLAAGVV